MKKLLLPITIEMSSICDRFCNHCSGDATMNSGNFLSLENAQLFAKEKNRLTKEYLKKNLSPFFILQFTGNGEPFLNPNFVEILDILFKEDTTTQGGIVTSGINSEEEKEHLDMILKRPYANQLGFALSFNLFQKGFPRRVTKTAGFLFKNGVNEVTIKICQTNEAALRTIRELDKILLDYFTPWAKKVNPLLSRYDAFYPSDIGRKLPEQIQFWCKLDLSDSEEEKNRKIKSNFIEVRNPSQKNLALSQIIGETLFPQSFKIETVFGTKNIIYSPHFLSKKGRAMNLKWTGFPLKKHLKPCEHFKQFEEPTDYDIKLGADGYYYPCCSCPARESMRIGHVSCDIEEIIQLHYEKRQKLLSAIIRDKSPYKTFCDHCVLVAQRERIFLEK